MLFLGITLSIAFLAIMVRFTVTEEIESLGASLIAGLCLFLSVFFAPLMLKVIILLFLLLNHFPVSSFFSKQER